MMAQHQELSSS